MSSESITSFVRTIASAGPEPPPDATITPRTQGLEAPVDPGSREESLPRISLADSVEGEDARPGGADLEIIGVLGEGGLGRVLLARQRSVGREVAVKVARDRERGSAALRVEARTMGRLEHPNIVPVHAMGVDDEGELVLVMKRIEGVDWRALLRDPEHPWWDRLDVAPSNRQSFHLDVLAQIASALHFAHERGIVHRDVKPENVLIGTHGDVYLTDWGVASLPDERSEGAPSAVVGTPAYMAPEMVLGDPALVDARTDVFLLGATLHEILVGKPRHPWRSLQQVLVAAFSCEPYAYPDAIPEELAALARAATARDPMERPESALAFRRALDTWRVHRGAIALTQRARAIATQARALRDSGGRDALADVDRMLVEARFGLTQALREWPEHEPARRALHDVLVMAAENDLARESVHDARAHLAELDAPPAALVEAVEALEAKLTAARDERERLVALERDFDLSVASRERRTFIGMVLASGLLVMVSLVARLAWARRVSGAIELVGVVAVALVPALGFAIAMRRRGTQNTAGAAFVNAIVMAMGAVLAHRIIGALADTPVHVVLATDCVIYAVVLGALRPVAPRIALLSPWLLLGAVAVFLIPSRAAFVFGVVLLTLLVTLYARWRWLMGHARNERVPRAPAS